MHKFIDYYIIIYYYIILKKIGNEYINSSIKDIYKKYSTHCQDPTRDLLDTMVEFACWCPYLELEPLKFWSHEM